MNPIALGIAGPFVIHIPFALFFFIRLVFNSIFSFGNMTNLINLIHYVSE